MEFPEIITIDGPAASGKTTLGKMIADELGYLFFDTGVMYRAVTWLVLENAVDIADETRVTQLANSIDIDVRAASVEDGRSVDVLANGTDITWKIRSPEVDATVSQVSAYPGVRSALTVQQRRIGLRGKIVMVGRDIGTVVLPEAGLKIYLDATVEERARRRYVECLARGEEVDYHSTLDSMKHRDQIDSTRKIAPLRPAEDSVCINTNFVPLEQVFNQIMAHIKLSRNSPQKP
jgi:cytidylate kinase